MLNSQLNSDGEVGYGYWQGPEGGWNDVKNLTQFYDQTRYRHYTMQSL